MRRLVDHRIGLMDRRLRLPLHGLMQALPFHLRGKALHKVLNGNRLQHAKVVIDPAGLLSDRHESFLIQRRDANLPSRSGRTIEDKHRFPGDFRLAVTLMKPRAQNIP